MADRTAKVEATVEATGERWRERPAILAAIGGLAGFVLWLLLDLSEARDVLDLSTVARSAWAAGVLAWAMGVGFTLTRMRMWWSLGFAAAIGLLAGSVLYWNGYPGHYPGDWGWDWRNVSLLVAVAIAVPLFQTARDAGAARWHYAEAYGNAWTNVILWFAAWAFVGITMALAGLLAELFKLIGLRFLSDLLHRGWFIAPLMGSAFGAALGLFRERDRVVRLLQSVVTAVASVLAPVLAVGLTVFLFALPFTGLSALWDATKATTPILLACAIGALTLANAVIGNGEPDEELRHPALRWAALMLALTVLPLAIIAAVATGLRIDQYGFTPDRLWALTFVIVACAWGLAYLVAVIRGRRAWDELARPANLKLAFGLGAVALILALPIVSFDAISTRDQVARLEKGTITPNKFDWAALGFDFGDAGRAALKRLTASSNPAIAQLARQAAAKTNRYDLTVVTETNGRRNIVAARVRVLPQQVALPSSLVDVLPEWNVCGEAQRAGCIVLYRPGATEAFTVAEGCRELTSAAPACQAHRLALSGGSWRIADGAAAEPDAATRSAMARAAARGAIEVRPVTRRQVFVGGHPIGDSFE